MLFYLHHSGLSWAASVLQLTLMVQWRLQQRRSVIGECARCRCCCVGLSGVALALWMACIEDTMSITLACLASHSSRQC